MNDPRQMLIAALDGALRYRGIDTYADDEHEYRTLLDQLVDAVAPLVPSLTHDGHHSMAQLYFQRAAYHALFVNLQTTALPGGLWYRPATKSWNHHDGRPCFGKTEPGDRWFVVTMYLGGGTQITQHYPEWMWDAFAIDEAQNAPEWDGHTSHEADARLAAYLGIEHRYA